MAAFVKFNAFIDEISKGGHNLQTCVYKAALTNTAPAPASDTVWSAAVYPPPAAAGGYPAGGNTPTVTSATTSGGVFKLVLVDSVFTATGAGIGPFRYVILYDSSASNKLIGFYDNGASVTLNAGDTFTCDFDGRRRVHHHVVTHDPSTRALGRRTVGPGALGRPARARCGAGCDRSGRSAMRRCRLRSTLR